MLTVGVDLAAQPQRTAVAWLDWTTRGCSLREVRLGCDDDAVVDALRDAGKSGIDCPLGWPAPFVEFVRAHSAGHVPISPGEGRRELTMRLTDRVVHERIGMTPLSVSADKIGHVAMRCAVLLARLAGEGRPVDRTGGGPVVEVYPAASLHRWGLDHRGYKRAPNVARLGELVDALHDRAPWLEFGSHEELCRASDDATDAVVAALTARAAALGRTTPPGEGQVGLARTEGWIALPEGSLDELRP
jgi:predicted nuclease with RNAse H fold